jgi:heme A synthase
MLIAVLAVLVLATVASFAADAQTLTGSYTRGRDTKKPAALSAVLTPVEGEAGKWAVVYTAKFNGKDIVYKGTATGDLAATLTGTAADAKGKRTWRFEAKLVDGALVGEHWETTGGKDSRTGALELKAEVVAEPAKTE